MKYCSVNGKQQSDLAITERGLAYGDGIFTTAKVVNGEVVFLDKHIKRLIDGCKCLKIKVALTEKFIDYLKAVAINYPLAVLKVIITAGSGGRGYSRIGLSNNTTNIIVMVSDFPNHYQTLALQGINLGDSEQQISISPMLSGLKHLNRLEQVLLRAELDERLEDDLVVTNYLGEVVEVTSSNLFYFLDGQLCTPDLSKSGVDGIIRQVIIAHYPQVRICQTRLEDLKKSQSMFICNSLMGIMPVKTYNNRHLDLDVVIQLQRQMKKFI
jgi:4-amino-4-deoxychorismate lyase